MYLFLIIGLIIGLLIIGDVTEPPNLLVVVNPNTTIICWTPSLDLVIVSVSHWLWLNDPLFPFFKQRWTPTKATTRTTTTKKVEEVVVVAVVAVVVGVVEGAGEGGVLVVVAAVVVVGGVGVGEGEGEGVGEGEGEGVGVAVAVAVE
jgi:hypothetical protein